MLLYCAYQAQSDALAPLRLFADAARGLLDQPWPGIGDLPLVRGAAAALGRQPQLQRGQHPASQQSFDMLVLDAFSSDAIPVHLLTREAMHVYKGRLKPGGMMAFHISNRYLNLRPILARLAEDAELVAHGWYDLADDKDAGKLASEWIIMARNDDDFGPVLRPYGRDKNVDRRWERIQPKPDTPLWTNNFSNLLSAFGREE